MGDVARQEPEDDHVGRDHQEQAPNHRALAQAGRRVLQLVQAGAPGDEAIDGPGGEAEQAQFLARRRIDGQPVGVIGVPLSRAYFRILAVAPNAALAQQPMRGQPGAGQQQRSPPRVTQEDDCGGDAADHLDHAVGNKIHRDGERRSGHAQVEIAGHGKVRGQGRIFQVPDARWAHAGFGQPVVKPGCGAVAQVGAERLVDGAEHLDQDKDPAGKGQRAGERVAALHGADQHAHGDGKRCRQNAAQQQHASTSPQPQPGPLWGERRRTSIPCEPSMIAAWPQSPSTSGPGSTPYNTKTPSGGLANGMHGMRDLLERQIDQALGRSPADLVVRNARVLNLVTGELEKGDIAVCGSTIVGTLDSYRGVEEIDAQGRFAVPGFIDSHVHCESTLVTPGEFDRCVLPHGVTTAICDPHEIANVLGLVGLHYFLDSAQNTALDLRVQLSSCVPATNLETSGARLTAADLIPHRHHPKVIGLAEFMNVPGVLNKDPECMEKLAAFQGQHIDGHAPLLSGHGLNAYLSCGIRNCHETTNLAEGREKLAKGMQVLIREGSVSKDLDALYPLINEFASPFPGLLHRRPQPAGHP